MRTLLLYAFSGLALLAGAAGCSGGATSTTCPVGSVDCTCYPNDTCNDDLECRSGTCHDPGHSGDGGSSSGAAGADQRGRGGAPAETGGRQSDGGASTTRSGGTTAGGSETDATGGTESNGGSSRAGGTRSSGGDSTGGTDRGAGHSSSGGEDGGAISGGTGGLGGEPSGGSTGSVGGGTSGSGGDASGGSGGEAAGGAGGIPATCGNGRREPTEGCDDGNTVPGDGCSSLCKLEPDCHDGQCTSACGDGLVFPNEECDDGNDRDGDGCAANCTVEAGHTCAQAPLESTLQVPITYRDFRASHADFEPGALGLYEPTTGLVRDLLDEEGKPQFAGEPTDGYITSADTFAEWYRNVPDANSTHQGVLTLYDNGAGGYVNRYGASGELWYTYEEEWCGYAGSEVLDEGGEPIPCTYCLTDDPETPECDEPYEVPCDTRAENLVGCRVSGSSYWGQFATESFNGNPLFFPLDDVDGTITPATERAEAVVPPPYGQYQADDGDHNFHFTTELHSWFAFDAARLQILEFMGDDDVWVFINNHLAVDLGGLHTPASGRLELAASGNGHVAISTWETGPVGESDVTLGLEDGQVYEIVVFHAERQMESSTYQLTLPAFNAASSHCQPE